jgi:hypothetical protein
MSKRFAKLYFKAWILLMMRLASRPTSGSKNYWSSMKGFGDPDAVVIGEPRIVKLLPADASLLSDRSKNNWPNVKLYAGHNNSRAPGITDIHSVNPEMVKAIEQSCVGGCLSTP